LYQKSQFFQARCPAYATIPSSRAQTASIDITVGWKLLYSACDADDCSVGTNWELIQVASGEGKSVDLAIDAEMRGMLGEMWCYTACANAERRQRRILETSAQLMREVDHYRSRTPIDRAPPRLLIPAHHSEAHNEYDPPRRR
jgi:hypothetical protein